MIVFRFILLFLIFLCSCSSDEFTYKRISIFDFIVNREKYSGKKVIITGYFNNGNWISPTRDYTFSRSVEDKVYFRLPKDYEEKWIKQNSPCLDSLIEIYGTVSKLEKYDIYISAVQNLFPKIKDKGMGHVLGLDNVRYIFKITEDDMINCFNADGE